MNYIIHISQYSISPYVSRTFNNTTEIPCNLCSRKKIARGSSHDSSTSHRVPGMYRSIFFQSNAGFKTMSAPRPAYTVVFRSADCIFRWKARRTPDRCEILQPFPRHIVAVGDKRRSRRGACQRHTQLCETPVCPLTTAIR